MNWNSDEANGWAEQFDHWIQEKVEAWDTEALFQYDELAPYAEMAVPTSEHFIPLFIAMGPVTRSVTRSCFTGVISMAI